MFLASKGWIINNWWERSGKSGEGFRIGLHLGREKKALPMEKDVSGFKSKFDLGLATIDRHHCPPPIVVGESHQSHKMQVGQKVVSIDNFKVFRVVTMTEQPREHSNYSTTLRFVWSFSHDASQSTKLWPVWHWFSTGENCHLYRYEWTKFDYSLMSIV